MEKSPCVCAHMWMNVYVAQPHAYTNIPEVYYCTKGFACLICLSNPQKRLQELEFLLFYLGNSSEGFLMQLKGHLFPEVSLMSPACCTLGILPCGARKGLGDRIPCQREAPKRSNLCFHPHPRGCGWMWAEVVRWCLGRHREAMASEPATEGHPESAQ